MRNVISSVFKRGTLSFMSAVLALSTLTPVLGAQAASAADPELSADVTCVDEKAVLTVTARQAELPGLPENAENWSAFLGLPNIHYTTDFGMKSQTLTAGDVDYSVFSTGETEIPASSVSAKVTGVYSTKEVKLVWGFPITYDKWHSYEDVLMANYEAKDCSPVVIPEIPTTQKCSEFATVVSGNLSQWDVSKTRAAGYNEVIADGLHVYTRENDGGDYFAKAAAYLPVDYPLSANGSQTIAESIEWVQNTGVTAPGLQIKVDLNKDGTVDGTLVGEAVYGNDWWLADSNGLVSTNTPRQAHGYANVGTINEWLALYPDAQVKAIGYSLGSGVYADGVIKKLVFGCTEYTFAKVVETPSEENPGNTNGGGNTNGSDTGGNLNNNNGGGSGTPVFAVADIFGINDDEETTDSGLAALGTASKDEGGEVAGATDNKDDKGCGIFLGICWYYWIPIVLAILAVVYAVRRRLQANNA